MHIDPSPEQAEAFAANAAGSGPVFMLNLLRFAEPAGAESYARYAAATGEHLERVGGEIVWAGACADALIGPGAREWDAAAIVRYPSRGAFLEMVGDPGYLEIAQHRTAGLPHPPPLPRDRAAPHGGPRRLAPDPLRPGAARLSACRSTPAASACAPSAAPTVRRSSRRPGPRCASGPSARSASRS